jgi:two-component system OmpR family response regulator
MNEHILVVDDDPDTIEICARALSQAGRGYVVATAPDAEQARAHVERRAFDLLILDIHLPEEDGMSLLRYIRESQPDLPAMLISGYPEVDNVMDAIRLHVREYLCKPFTVRKFLEAVEASLRNPDA